MKNEGRIRESSVTLGREKGGRGGWRWERERSGVRGRWSRISPAEAKKPRPIKIGAAWWRATAQLSRGEQHPFQGRTRACKRPQSEGPSIDKLFLLMTYLLAGRYREAAAYRYNLPIFEAPPPTPSLCSLCATLWTHAAFYFSSFLSFFSIRFASLFAGRVRSIVVCKVKRIEGIFSFLFPFFLVFNESGIIDTQRAIGLKRYF